MHKVSQYPLSPHGSVYSTFSGQTNSARASSMTTYSNAPSVRSAGDAVRSKYSKAPMSPELRAEQRQATKLRSAGSSRVHTRASSNASMSSFPAFDAATGYENVISPPPPAKYQEYATAARSASVSSASKVKIKPFLRKIASQEKGSIELSRSVAENEGLGIYTASSNRRGTAGGDGVNGGRAHPRDYHMRTGSAVSQSSAVTSSSRKGAQYVHPMRQTPQSYTPPVMHSSHGSCANSDDGADHYSTYSYTNDRTPPPGMASSSYATSSLPTPYAPLPPTSPSSHRTPPPPLFIRSHSASRLHSSSSQTTIPPLSAGTPSSQYRTPLDHIDNVTATSPPPLSEPFPYAQTRTPSTSHPATARSSLDSAFRSLPGKRSRANTNNDDIDPIARVAALRADFAAKEAAKDEKYAAARSRALEKEARRQERRDESARRKMEAGNSRNRSRARSTATVNSRAASEQSVPLAVVEYSATRPAKEPVRTGRPDVLRDEELEYIRQGKKPPKGIRSKGRSAAAAAAARNGAAGRDLEKGGDIAESVVPGRPAVRGGWSSFWFGMKTMWLKLKRSMGVRGG